MSINKLININNYRNIGICAHIDAGKTSVTERVLYYTGKIFKLGEVHDGEAVMDYTDQERERGITIFSAVTTVYWSGIMGNRGVYKINIIDTPGHIDFTAEVERSLYILDGVCLILCGVSGIQSQTETIWNHINNNNIPCVIFINKLDRKGSDYLYVCKHINIFLNRKGISLYYPHFNNQLLLGFYDIVNLVYYEYKDLLGNDIINHSINDKYYIKLRNELIEYLVEGNEIYFNKYINNTLSVNDIKYLIRRLTISNNIIPIICGSALKNKGIQLLLDSIIDYLPSPIDIKVNKLLSSGVVNNNIFSAIVFKIINDDYSGTLSLLRIYSGTLVVGDKFINVRNNSINKVISIIEIHANNRINKTSASIGDIIGLVGIKNIVTGDTLCNPSNIVLYKPIIFSLPVISLTIDVKKSDASQLYYLFKQYIIEDPTIVLRFDSRVNKYILSGMGELHLEIFLERIRRITSIKFKTNKPIVNFMETITKSLFNVEGKYIKQSGGRGQYGHIVINIKPTDYNNKVKCLNKLKGGVIPIEYINPIFNTIEEFCSMGYLLGYPIVGLEIELIMGSYHIVDSNENAFKQATIKALNNAMTSAGIVILEPIMLVKINIPETFLGVVTSDIKLKRGTIVNVVNTSSINNINNSTPFINTNNNIILVAKIPMFELFNYSTILRSKTKGKGNFTISLNGYSILPNNLVNKINHD